MGLLPSHATIFATLESDEILCPVEIALFAGHVMELDQREFDFLAAGTPPKSSSVNTSKM
ncbi:hypothetical protein D3261_04015 [Halococcus sp. IIIV-5B]|nr:hypothetical protein D3261_04015 [Halococcus sp. IIIV-5B]